MLLQILSLIFFLNASEIFEGYFEEECVQEFDINGKLLEKKSFQDEDAGFPSIFEMNFFSDNIIFKKEQKNALLEYLCAFSKEKYNLYSIDSCYYYLDDEKDPIKSSLRKGKPWETEVQKLFCKYALPNSTVVDIGAHIGMHTLFLARCVGEQGDVYAFEWNLKHFRELTWNVFLNTAFNVKLFCGEIGEERMKVGGNLPDIEKTSIDSFYLNNVSLIRINGQGHEDEILRGAMMTIRINKPVIIIKILGDMPIERMDRFMRKIFYERSEMLRNMGYKISRISANDYLAIPLNVR